MTICLYFDDNIWIFWWKHLLKHFVQENICECPHLSHQLYIRQLRPGRFSFDIVVCLSVCFCRKMTIGQYIFFLPGNWSVNNLPIHIFSSSRKLICQQTISGSTCGTWRSPTSPSTSSTSSRPTWRSSQRCTLNTCSSQLWSLITHQAGQRGVAHTLLQLRSKVYLF